MIAGMMTPSQSEGFTYPAHIKGELKDYLIDITLDKGEDWVITNETLGTEGIYKKSMDVLKSREKAVLQLMERHDWDFLMAVFTATDRIMHFLWEYFASNQSKFVEEVETFFQYLDKVIGEIVERLSEDDNLLIVSDHGFDKAPQKVINVNSWLHQMEWLQPISNRFISNAPSRLFQKQAFRSTIKKLMPRKMRNYLRREISGSLKIAVNWSKTKAYYIPMYNYVCGIGINRLSVRENGIVAEEEYETLRDEIINRSLEIVDSDTGQEIVEKALRREDIYSGKFIGKIPDVIIFLKPEYMGSPLLDSKLISPAQRLKTGDHKEEGIFIFSGPNAQRGCLHGDQSITDIPPTICCLMGLPVNKAYDGKVIEKAIRSEFIEDYPSQHEDISEKLAAYKKERKIINIDEYTETVKERLEALGYL